MEAIQDFVDLSTKNTRQIGFYGGLYMYISDIYMSRGMKREYVPTSQQVCHSHSSLGSIIYSLPRVILCPTNLFVSASVIHFHLFF